MNFHANKEMVVVWTSMQKNRNNIIAAVIDENIVGRDRGCLGVS